MRRSSRSTAGFHTRAAAVRSWLAERFARRPQFTWAVCAAAAAAIVIAVTLPSILAPAPFEVTLHASSGIVRSGSRTFSPSEQLHLELRLPEPQ